MPPHRRLKTAFPISPASVVELSQFLRLRVVTSPISPASAVELSQFVRPPIWNFPNYSDLRSFVFRTTSAPCSSGSFSARRWLGSVADYLLPCAVLFFPLHRTPRDEAEKATKREDLRGVSPAPEKKSEEHGREAPASTRLEAILLEDRYT